MTGLVGLAFKPTDRLMGTRSNLGAVKEKEIRVDVKVEHQKKTGDDKSLVPKQGPLLKSQVS